MLILTATPYLLSASLPRLLEGFAWINEGNWAPLMISVATQAILHVQHIFELKVIRFKSHTSNLVVSSLTAQLFLSIQNFQLPTVTMNSTAVSGDVLGGSAVTPPDLMKSIYILNINTVASSLLFFWDTLLNLDRELKYIWKSKFSYITVLFGIIRLLVTGANITGLFVNFGIWETTDSNRKAEYWLLAIFGLAISTCVDILLIFRVYALYGRNKILLRLLCIMEAIALVAVASVILLAFKPNIQSVTNPFSYQLPIVVIVYFDTPDIIYIGLPILFVQTSLFFLALGRHIYLIRDGLKLSGTTSHIYHTFIRDGVWIFFILLVCLLLCAIGSLRYSILGDIALRWTYALAGITASHLVINLRSANHESEGRTLETSSAYTEVLFATVEGTAPGDLRTQDTHENP